MSFEGDFEPKPDRVDRALRFAIGFLPGAACGIFVYFHNLDSDAAFVAATLIGGTLTGVLAAWWGDRFWLRARALLAAIGAHFRRIWWWP